MSRENFRTYMHAYIYIFSCYVCICTSKRWIFCSISERSHVFWIIFALSPTINIFMILSPESKCICIYFLTERKLKWKSDKYDYCYFSLIEERLMTLLNNRHSHRHEFMVSATISLCRLSLKLTECNQYQFNWVKVSCLISLYICMNVVN